MIAPEIIFVPTDSSIIFYHDDVLCRAAVELSGHRGEAGEQGYGKGGDRALHIRPGRSTMRPLILSLALPLACLPVVAYAEGSTERPPSVRWEIVPGLTSANLSAAPSQLVGSSGLGWPDGRQAVVTFWSAKNPHSTIRCTAYFDKDMRQTGEKCERPAE